MKLKLLLLLSAFIHCAAIAQHTDKQFQTTAWAIKGKVLPWSTIVFPISGMNYTFGVEYGFGKVNSIGIDLVYNDVVTHKHYLGVKDADSAGPNAFSVSRGIFLNYRRYIDLSKTLVAKPMKKLIGSDYLPYLSSFVRFGNQDFHYDLNYETKNITHDERQYSAGLLFGIVANCIDINMGPFYKQTYTIDVDMKNGAPVTTSNSTSCIGFRLGVNLYFVLTNSGSHYLSKYASLKDCQN